MEIVILIFLLLFAAITAASEISIIAVSRIKLRRLIHSGSKAARDVLKILETPGRFFGTILVSNNIVDALIAVLITALVIRVMGLSERLGIVVATLIASFLIIVSEVTAKTLAARFSEKISIALAMPIRTLIIIFAPIVRILEAITKVLSWMLGIKPAGGASLVTEEEIRAFIKIGEEDGVLHKEKSRMLSKVFDFGNTIVKNVMTPKKEMVAIDISSGFEYILEKVLETGYSRIPVYKNNPDNIVGIINMKDLLSLSCNKDLIVLNDIIYPAVFFPEAKKVTELLKEFQKGHTHIAIVRDAKGGISGLVTLEDLLEEIVGEIEDEYDVRANYYKNPE